MSFHAGLSFCPSPDPSHHFLAPACLPIHNIGTTGELPEVFSCPGGAVKV